MKNIYKVTNGQLIVIWVFGIIGFLISIDQLDYSGFATFLVVLIPALLLFYTIGWRHFNKKNKSINKIKEIDEHFCHECGPKNASDSKYCLECGNLIIS